MAAAADLNSALDVFSFDLMTAIGFGDE